MSTTSPMDLARAMSGQVSEYCRTNSSTSRRRSPLVGIGERAARAAVAGSGDFRAFDQRIEVSDIEPQRYDARKLHARNLATQGEGAQRAATHSEVDRPV